jgi:hypothetical protein
MLLVEDLEPGNRVYVDAPRKHGNGWDGFSCIVTEVLGDRRYKARAVYFNGRDSGGTIICKFEEWHLVLEPGSWIRA